ncbi:MAG TPA: hypothetical protein VHN78_12495, partial [Chloroflexota bacterium]|nr:hypothetical protein [Chloroflexota bacterium]
VFSVLIALGLLAFGRRLTGDTGVAALALVLFLLGGGLGWLVTVAAAAGSTEGLRAVLLHPWDEQAQRAANFQWKDVYFSLIMPQRAYLYGLPLALLVLTLLFAAVQQQGRSHSHYLVAGVVAGLLPLAHLGTLLALALLTPALALLFPTRRWVLFFAAWVVIAAPQLGLLLGSEHQAGAVRLQVGWMAGDDAWPWFWLKNLGFFLPLLGLALVRRRGMPAPGYRFLWAFMPVFVAGNLVVFQPWAWDNTKIFVYWFLGVCILVAALLAHAWRAHPVHPEQDVMHSVRAAAVHGLVAGAVLVMTLPGLLANLNQLLGKDRHLLLTAEELRVAAAVREQTPRRSVFAVGLQHNHPVTVMTGRPVVMGYPGWLWTHGYDYTERERDLRTIYAFGPNAPELLKKYGVSFLVMGPTERQQLGGDSAAYRRHYRTIVRSANYEVFAEGKNDHDHQAHRSPPPRPEPWGRADHQSASRCAGPPRPAGAPRGVLGPPRRRRRRPPGVVRRDPLPVATRGAPQLHLRRGVSRLHGGSARRRQRRRLPLEHEGTRARKRPGSGVRVGASGPGQAADAGRHPDVG